MLQIKKLYGRETIIHFPLVDKSKKTSSLIMSNSIVPNWIEGIIEVVGDECQKRLSKGDVVIVNKDRYLASPLLTRKQFNLPAIESGEYRIVVEYDIALLVEPLEDEEEVVEEDTDVQKKIAELDAIAAVRAKNREIDL